MSAPFSFDLSGGGFRVGADSAAAMNTASATAATGSSASASAHPQTIVPPCRTDAFPGTLHSPTLPACPLLYATPAVHPLRGRVLLATRAFQPGECVLHEHAFIHSNWDAFRCADCDKPHMTRSCAVAKKKWPKKLLAKMDAIEGSLLEADCIGELDHARSFIKLMHMYMSESTVGATTTSLGDFFALSYTHYPEALAGLTGKLPYQSASPKDILEDAGLWPAGLTVEEAAKMLAILNTNSHELSDIRGTGVFLRASLMEHSCAPNCNFSTTGRELQIIALRPIAAGENLSIDYGMGMYRPVSHRRAGLKRSHGFTCFCVACTQLPDRARAFTCPTVSQGGRCTGVVYPVGVDDREQEANDWRELVAEAAAAHAAAGGSEKSVLPEQAFSVEYPRASAASWTCTVCASTLTQSQIAQCLEREKQAAKKLKGYKDEEEQEEERGGAKKEEDFDFDGKKGDDDDDDDEEGGMDEDDDADDDGDEIRPPGEILAALSSLDAPALHPSHHLLFWAAEFYARSASADSEFAADAIPIFTDILAALRQYIAPLGQELHDSLMIYADYLAQVLVVTGRIDEARAAFTQAWKYSCALNGPSHHSSLDLQALVEDTPNDGEELQMKYAQFQAAMEALIYDTQVRAKKKKAKAKGGKKKGEGRARDALSDDDGEAGAGGAGAADDDDVEPGVDIAVTRQNQMEILQQMEAMMLSQRAADGHQDGEGDDAIMDERKEAAAKPKPKKKKGGKK